MGYITLKNIKIIGIDFFDNYLLIEADDELCDTFSETNLIIEDSESNLKFVKVKFKWTQVLDKGYGIIVNGSDIKVDIYKAEIIPDKPFYRLFLQERGSKYV